MRQLRLGDAPLHWGYLCLGLSHKRSYATSRSRGVIVRPGLEETPDGSTTASRFTFLARTPFSQEARKSGTQNRMSKNVPFVGLKPQSAALVESADAQIPVFSSRKSKHRKRPIRTFCADALRRVLTGSWARSPAPESRRLLCASHDFVESQKLCGGRYGSRAPRWGPAGGMDDAFGVD